MKLFIADAGYVKETKEHKDLVKINCDLIADAIKERGIHHDDSKLQDPELSFRVKFEFPYPGAPFGSKEYDENIKALEPGLKTHYKENLHHPEHFENGIRGMTLIDIVEMLCDWVAASNRKSGSPMEESVEFLADKYSFSEDLKDIFLNTIQYLKEHDVKMYEKDGL